MMRTIELSYINTAWRKLSPKLQRVADSLFATFVYLRISNTVNCRFVFPLITLMLLQYDIHSYYLSNRYVVIFELLLADVYYNRRIKCER